jgi:pyruvate dehydrogenase E1 component beta subunit
MVQVALEAASLLEREGISAEVIDPRTIAPLDRGTIVASVQKTGRLAVVDEAAAACGFSGEVFAVACEHCFDYLDVRPVRICSLHVPNPFSPVLENQMIPTPERVASEIREKMEL